MFSKLKSGHEIDGRIPGSSLYPLEAFGRGINMDKGKNKSNESDCQSHNTTTHYPCVSKFQDFWHLMGLIML